MEITINIPDSIIQSATEAANGNKEGGLAIIQYWIKGRLGMEMGIEEYEFSMFLDQCSDDIEEILLDYGIDS